jgi:hypothetical protein
MLSAKRVELPSFGEGQVELLGLGFIKMVERGKVVRKTPRNHHAETQGSDAQH